MSLEDFHYHLLKRITSDFMYFNINRFAIQLVNALRFMAKHRVIHCDLKPENILLNEASKNKITVIDIGSSCFENETSKYLLDKISN
jgi:serine/threonine protein kinase